MDGYVRGAGFLYAGVFPSGSFFYEIDNKSHDALHLRLKLNSIFI
ncbi:B30.2/SPRY domain-containing protein [Priestia megaterium]|uniref:Uncharacterized protein n=1 Tax=Priestia megaterium (strain ATCC 12872 / QMB1551) TaxID=545693 RepID=D5E3E4_PRIM1|nr:hypothetical protein BMQ_pBM40031 [Priestia megaterium QM B1551]